MTMVVEDKAAGEGEALRAPAARLHDGAAHGGQAGDSLLGEVSTEITFELPSTRFRDHRGQIAGPALQAGRSHRLHPARGKPHRHHPGLLLAPAGLFFIRPFTLLGPTFIGDDRKIVELQQEGLKFDPALMLIQDADQPAIWYHRVKKSLGRDRSKTARNSSILAGTGPALEVLALSTGSIGQEKCGPVSILFTSWGPRFPFGRLTQ